MNLAQKIFALKKIPPFTELRDAELGLVVKVVRERRFSPGRIVANAGSSLSSLYVVLEGFFELEDGRVLLPIIGMSSLLFDYSLTQNLLSGKSGALCLTINKGHFYTLIHECPSFAAGLMKLLHEEDFCAPMAEN
ncbi:MAG: cyclic nucleotide-binding domain-containing protein [Candidatus Omnitrophota bacterium]